MKKTENFLSEYWCCVSLIAKLVMANRLHLEEQFGWEQCARQAGSVLQIVQSYEQSCQRAPHWKLFTNNVPKYSCYMAMWVAIGWVVFLTMWVLRIRRLVTLLKLCVAKSANQRKGFFYWLSSISDTVSGENKKAWHVALLSDAACNINQSIPACKSNPIHNYLNSTFFWDLVNFR